MPPKGETFRGSTSESDEFLKTGFHGKKVGPRTTTFRIKPEALKPKEDVSENVAWIRNLKQGLRTVIDLGHPITVVPRTLGADTKAYKGPITLEREGQRELLFTILQTSEDVIDGRIQELDRQFPGLGKTRWLGARLREHRQFSSANIKRKDIPYAAADILKAIPLAANTPINYREMEIPKDEILTSELLNKTLENFNLSNDSDSVSTRLRDPIGLSNDGLALDLRTEGKAAEINYGFVIPEQLLQILGTFKHSPAESVFRDWVLLQCSMSSKNTKGVIKFLEALINFSSFLDSKSTVELFNPPEAPGRDPEFLLNPLHTILNTLKYVRTTLYRAKANSLLVSDFGRLQRLVYLRYGEVYARSYQSSLFTAEQKALIPAPEGFAKYARLISEKMHETARPAAEIARALIKLAESIGVKDVSALMTEFSNWPEVLGPFIEGAKRIGFINDPTREMEVSRDLKKNPWRDAVNIDFSQVINDTTTHFNVRILTGTFGPLTQGHVDFIERSLRLISSTGKNGESGGKHKQEILLVLPVPDVGGLPNYKKHAAQIGTIFQRGRIILYSLPPSELDRNILFLSTILQPPNLAVQGDLETSIRDTCTRFFGKISSDLIRANKRGGLVFSYSYMVGPDELEWLREKSKLVLAPRSQQRSKVSEHDCDVVLRHGWTVHAIRNWRLLKSETQVQKVIATPGTPNSSSSASVDQIRKTGTADTIMPAAQRIALEDYSHEAVLKRTTLLPMSVRFSIDDINGIAVRKAEKHFGVTF